MHRRSKCAIENSRVAAQSVVVVLVLGVVLVLVTVLAAAEVVAYVIYIQCTMCSLYSKFSFQPDKLRHILKFLSSYTIQHILGPACSNVVPYLSQLVRLEGKHNFEATIEATLNLQFTGYFDRF